jgi:SET domain-containing protein
MLAPYEPSLAAILTTNTSQRGTSRFQCAHRLTGLHILSHAAVSQKTIDCTCQPNCEAIENELGRVFIETLRTAMPGDELLIAYRLTTERTFR